MDIEAAGAVTAAISAAASAAGTAVGSRAWDGLLALARRAVGRGETGTELATVSESTVDPAVVDVADEQQVRELTATLIGRTSQDPALATELTSWAREHAAALGLDLDLDQSAVHNTVSDNAQVKTLIQGRDFHGTINIVG